MAGYSRQSVADIIANEVIKAAPINAEYNALRDAFAFATGHKHDGSSTEGAYVPLIADTDAHNKVVVDTANNRISFYSEVSSTAVEQLRIQDGKIVPVTDDDIDLGAVGAEFKDLYIDGIGYIDTVQVHENATVTGNLTVNGTTTLATVDINGGNIDGTNIGASSPTSAAFTTVTTSGQATLATADINGGTIDGAVIGGTTPQAITGTTITGSSLVGPLTGAVTGNVTGNLTGNVTGNVTGDLTGNVTASSGTSSFNNVTINGGLDMNAGTSATITNLSTPVNAADAATKGYVDTSIANVIDSAPAALDTLNELAAALNDDANFSTTITNSIATKLPLAGGTMTGGIAMSTNKITGLGDPTANQDAATKVYVDTQRDTRLALAGGTMAGAINMGANKITTSYAPVDGVDLTNKTYVDSILGSATSAAASAAAAATSATDAANSAIASAASATDSASFSSLAQDWAIKTSGTVDGSDYSAKYWATSTPVTNVSTNITAITTLSNDLTSGGFVAGAIYDHGLITDTASGSVGSPDGFIVTVFNNLLDIQAVATIDSAVSTVAGISADVTTVALNDTDVSTVATNVADVTTTANNIANVNTVAGISSDVTAVAGVASDVSTVASNLTDVSNFSDVYLGPKSTAPTTRNGGSALVAGDLYFDTIANAMRYYNGTAWETIVAATGTMGTQDADNVNITGGSITGIDFDFGSIN